MAWLVWTGECVERMGDISSDSIDAICCDPPYGISFMSKEWDRLEVANANRSNLPNRRRPEGEKGDSPKFNLPAPSFDVSVEASRRMQEWHKAWACEALRILKPGGHLLAFGGTRTYHRLVSAVEDVGFEIRDTITWMYGSGFPKSMNLTDEWEGWGTGLKPASEPIVVARKPFRATVVTNMKEHGTGALNIDGARIETSDRWSPTGLQSAPSVSLAGGVDGSLNVSVSETHPAGRWPANVVLAHDERCIKVGTQNVRTAMFGGGGPRVSSVYGVDDRSRDAAGYGDDAGLEKVDLWACVPGCPVRMLDDQTGLSRSRQGSPRSGVNGDGWGMTATGAEYDDVGGASRFYYTSKASAGERNAGLIAFEATFAPTMGNGIGGKEHAPLCTCKTNRTWANEDQQASIQADSGPSAPRGTTGSGTPSSSDNGSTTMSSGNESTDLSPPDLTSTTETGISRTTASPTLNSSPSSITSANTPTPTDEISAADGNADAPSVESGSQQTPSTITSPRKAGSDTDGAAPATSRRSSRPSSSADKNVCPDCGGVIQGAVAAKRNLHPT